MKKAIGVHAHEFTKNSVAANDLDKLKTIWDKANSTIKDRDRKVVNRAEMRNTMIDMESVFRDTVDTLEEDQQDMLYSEMKNDFIEYLFLPFYCLGGKKYNAWEVSNQGCFTLLLLGSITISVVFYLLCLIWLFGAYTTVTGCGGPTEMASNSELCVALRDCRIPSMGPLADMRSYFTFRLVLYFLSPLTIISVAISSHYHQKHMQHRLTGLPHTEADKTNTGCSKDTGLFFTTAMVFIINVVLGLVTIVYDCLFLDHMTKNSGSSCSHIASGGDVGDQSFHLKPKLKEIPIPVLVFNFIYTIWGIFYCLGIVWHFKEVTDSGTEEHRMLMRGDSNYEKRHMSAKTWNARKQQARDELLVDLPHAFKTGSQTKAGSKTKAEKKAEKGATMATAAANNIEKKKKKTSSI